MEIQSALEEEAMNDLNYKTVEPSQTGNNPILKKPYSCHSCGKAFIKRSHLEQHVRIHTGEKPYSCSKCDKAFRESGKLKTHERIHTDEKPFSCSKCNKTFSQAGHLKTHERIHTGEKPFSCSKCEKKFTTSGNLKTHEKESILMRNHSAAQSVTTNATNQVV